MSKSINPLSLGKRHRAMRAIAALLLFLAWEAPAQTTHTINSSNANFATLQSDLSIGGTIFLNFTGTIPVTGTLTVVSNTMLITVGTNIPVLSGGGSVQMLQVPPGLSLTISNLTLSGGKSTGGNGSVGGNGSTTAGGSQGTAGGAGGSGTSGLGGAILNQGTTVAYACFFLTNTAVGGAGGAGGTGGIGSFTVGNGGTGGNGGNGFGGAIYNMGTLVLSNCAFTGNSTIGGLGGVSGAAVTNSSSVVGQSGNGGSGGVAEGAGLYTSNGCSATIVGCTFNLNFCQSGNSQPGSSSNGGNGNGANGIMGPNAAGGGIYNLGTNTLVNCTLVQNLAVAGNGGNGGNTTGFTGGNGGNGGSGLGGGLFNDNTGRMAITNCTFASGECFGGTNGAGGTGRNGSGSAGSSGSGFGANIANNGGTLLFKNSILVFPTNAPNAYGVITDQNNNISSDSSAGFTQTNSYNNTNPGVATALAANGGATLTLALNPNSPALDKIFDGSAPPTDQRGTLRPAHIRPDIGAFELGSTLFSIAGTITASGTGVGVSGVNVDASGSADTTTASNGTYSLDNLQAGTYIITPSKTGIAFTPTNIIVTVPPTTNSINFTAAPATFNITGQILLFGSTSNGFPKANLVLTGTNAFNNTTNYTAQADTNGNFAFSNLFISTYTLTPQVVSGASFAPTNSVITLNSNTAVTFTVTSVTNNIGVQINLGAGGFSNEPVALNGTNVFGTVIGSTNQTGASGQTGFSNLLSGSYVVTPQASAIASFSPSSVVCMLPPGSNVVFTAAAIPYNITGSVKLGTNGFAYSNILVVANGSNIFNNTTSYSNKTDNTGAYSLVGLPAGSYIVAAQPSGFLIPTSLPVSLPSNAVANFVGIPATMGISNVPSQQNVSLTLSGLPNLTYRIQSSSNVLGWQNFTNITTGTNGTFGILVTNGFTNLYFRAVIP